MSSELGRRWKTAGFVGLLIISIFWTGGQTNVYADTTFSDVKGHWAENAIVRFAEGGVLQGANGKFRPNDTITRAELTVLLNRLLKYPNQTFNPFTDIKQSDWYYQAVVNLARNERLRMNDNVFAGNEALERQEAIFMVARAFGVRGYQAEAKIKDLNQISDWAAPEVRTMFLYKYVKGNPDGTFRPHNKITRAEMASLLSAMIDVHINEPGTYSDLGRKKVLVTAANVVITKSKDMHLFVSPGAGNERGSVTIAEDAATSISRGFVVATNPEVCLQLRTNDKPLPLPGYVHLLAAEDDALFAGGYGEKTHPFLISNQEQLQRINQYPENHFKLANDITLSGEWAPLSKDAVRGFRGTFDGGGHTIRDLFITKETNAGLFYNLTGEVKNLNVKGRINNKGDLFGAQAGMIAARLTGVVSNCSVEVDIYTKGHTIFAGGIAAYVDVDGLIQNCETKGTIWAESYTFSTEPKIDKGHIRNGDIYAGGIVGACRDEARMTGCRSSMTVRATAPENPEVTVCVGGLSGSNGIIEKSSFSGKVTAEMNELTGDMSANALAGGIVGLLAKGAVSECSVTGTIMTKGSSQGSAGGIAGAVGTAIGGNGTLKNCYANASVNASGAFYQNNAGGVVGEVDRGSISACWSSGNISATGDVLYFNAVGGFVGVCFEDGEIFDCYTLASVSCDEENGGMGAFAGRLGGVVSRCYAAGTPAADSFVGSGRENPRLNQCGDFSNLLYKAPLFYSENGNDSEISHVSISELYKQETFASRGWDFINIWEMPDSGKYKLPILRNLDQYTQSSNPQPSHLI